MADAVVIGDKPFGIELHAEGGVEGFEGGAHLVEHGGDAITIGFSEGVALGINEDGLAGEVGFDEGVEGGTAIGGIEADAFSLSLPDAIFPGLEPWLFGATEIENGGDSRPSAGGGDVQPTAFSVIEVLDLVFAWQHRSRLAGTPA